MIIGLTIIFSGSLLAKADSLDIVVDSASSIVNKTFDELTSVEQDYFLSKGFDENDSYFSTITITQSDLSDSIINRAAANVLILTGSTKSVTNTQGRTEYIISSSNSRMSKVTVQLNLGNVKTYTSTVNLSSAYAYGGGMYFTYTGSRGYRSVRLTAQVLNTFGYGSVSCSAGGLTIGK
jgi:predicted RNA-binding protein with EMAP domain